MANKEKGREDGNTKIWISRERKELFRWNKNHFSWIFEGYHLVRTWEIDTSLKSVFVAVNCIFWKTGHHFTSILVQQIVCVSYKWFFSFCFIYQYGSIKLVAVLSVEIN